MSLSYKEQRIRRQEVRIGQRDLRPVLASKRQRKHDWYVILEARWTDSTEKFVYSKQKTKEDAEKMLRKLPDGGLFRYYILSKDQYEQNK